LKNGVLDPQGQAVLNAAHSLGFKEIQDVKLGKTFFLEMEGTDRARAKETLKELSDKLLANTVIENFEIELL
jgi:phosphoribosylformylglycinamidine synthase